MRQFFWMMATTIGVPAGACSAHAAALEITIVGLENQGRLKLAVVSEEDAWNGKAEALISIDAKVVSPSMNFRVDVPEGTVAVRLFHDENGNGKLDANALGLPLEGYGFSNNPRLMGPAKFSDASFLIKGEQTSIKIQVQ